MARNIKAKLVVVVLAAPLRPTPSVLKLLESKVILIGFLVIVRRFLLWAKGGMPTSGLALLES